MGTIVFPILGLLYLGASIWLLARAARLKTTPAGLLLGITLLGLAYDSLVIFLGKIIGAGTTLETLNQGRYLAHAALTPLYFLLSGWYAQKAGFSSARKGMPALIGLTVLSILVGVAGFFFLKYSPCEAVGTLRYIVDGANTPGWAHYAPIFVSALVDLVFIIVGIGLWRKLRWPWLVIGAVVMFFAAAVPPKIEFACMLNSIGELLLNASLLATCLKLKV